MSWITIGDNNKSCFGCDTMDKVFGHIYNCSVDELEEFGQSLPEDVRTYRDDDLYNLYLKWKEKNYERN